MSAFDSDISDISRGRPQAAGLLCEADGECVSKADADADADSDSTLRIVVTPVDTIRTKTVPPVDEAEQLQRWLSSLAPRFVCGEQHSSSQASWVFRSTDLESGAEVAVKLLKDSRPESRNARRRRAPP